MQTALANILTGHSEYSGDNAKNIPGDLALRIASRMARQAAKGSYDPAMPLAELVRRSRQRRLGAITHRHKRGKR